jgi:hypothetical protein
MPVVSLMECRARFNRLVESGGDPFLFAASVMQDVGLCDESGKRYLREDSSERHDLPGGGSVGGDVPTLGKTRHRKPTDFRWDVLAEAMIGPDWRRAIGLDRAEAGLGVVQEMKDRYSRLRMFSEEAAAASTGGPSAWANVAAWSATVGGLMQAQFLAGYEVAGYDMADLFPVKAPVFWQGGERYIDIIGPFTPAPEVGPGEEYPDMSMSALWVEPGPMKKYAGKISMYKETAAIDISGGQMMSKMKTAGEMLKYRENELSLDVLCGQTNNWKLGMLTDTSATAYNTYGATVTNPKGTARLIDNTLVNPFNDFGAMQVSDERLANLYHPVSDQPLMTDLNTVIFPTPMAAWAVALGAATEIELFTQTVAGPAQPPGGAGFPTAKMKIKNPWVGLESVVSRRLDARHVASTVQADPNLSAGLGLTGQARYRWYRLNRQKFACKRQFWPATTTEISPSDWVCATQGIIAASAFDIAVQIQVLDPYAVQRNLGS